MQGQLAVTSQNWPLRPAMFPQPRPDPLEGRTQVGSSVQGQWGSCWTEWLPSHHPGTGPFHASVSPSVKQTAVIVTSEGCSVDGGR